MAKMQQVEFSFPETKADEEEVKGGEVEVDLSDDGDGEGASAPAKPAAPPKAEEDDLELEVVDDTPEKDRGRKRSDPPEEVTDDELETYSDKVKQRIRHFSKGYHDERREKERAQRERDELSTYARQLLEENRRLKGSETRSHNTLLESAKKQVEGELKIAQRMYKEAYESGDSDKLLEAQQALNAAQIRADRLSGVKPKALQEERNPVQEQTQIQPRPVAPQRDEKAEAWREKNSWFGGTEEVEVEMTSYALGCHSNLVNGGYDPRSDEYYEQIDARMRQRFPEAFAKTERQSPQRRKAPDVVASATRSTAPTKIRLTESQVGVARRLGITPKEYARQLAALNTGGK